MKYFIDTEFIEGFWDAIFYKKRHFIDLISIGIVAEDGRTYYAISKEYNYRDASDWVKKNIILPMYLSTVSGDQRNRHSVDNFHKFYGLENEQIAYDVKRFIYKAADVTSNPENWGKEIPIEFYGYYADYDWVLFCSLFGRMIDLPKGFPMYCKDLKQILDEKCVQLKETPETIKELNGYPKQENEHNALADAKWNYELYKFIHKVA